MQDSRHLGAHAALVEVSLVVEHQFLGNGLQSSPVHWIIRQDILAPHPSRRQLLLRLQFIPEITPLTGCDHIQELLRAELQINASGAQALSQATGGL